MKKLLLIIGFLLCASCMRLNVPPARIEFVSIDRETYSSYNLRFTSDRDLINLYEVHGRRGQIGTSIHCSLDGDLDFSVEHKIALEAYGGVDDMRLIEGDRRYELSANIRFQNNLLNDGINWIRPVELIQILKPKDYVPCKVVITAFPFKAYYSKVMYIPASRIIAQVQSPRVAPERVSLKPADQPLLWLQFEPVCIVRWRYEAAPAYDQIGSIGLCSDVPYAGMLASFAPHNMKLRLVKQRDQMPKPLTAYAIVRGDGRRESGISAENGDTHRVGSLESEVLGIYVEEGVEAVERWTPQIDESHYMGSKITY